MGILIFLLISSAGVNSLLMPASPAGVITGFSLSRGNEAIFYNPANLDATNDFQLACYYNQFYVSTKSISLALSKKINRLNFGLGITNFDYGEIELRPEYPSDDSVTAYTANDFSLGISGSAAISSQGKIGVTLKYISENIYVYGDRTVAFDFALAYHSSFSGVSFGATNIGYKLTLNNEDVNLPAKLSLGGFIDLKKAILSLDVHYLVNNGKFEFGQAWRFPVAQAIELNAGINYREKFFPGFGFVADAGRFAVEYGTAIYPYNLGMINTLGITLSF